jgi:hypothetical protein
MAALMKKIAEIHRNPSLAKLKNGDFKKICARVSRMSLVLRASFLTGS